MTQYVAVSFRFGWSSLFFAANILSAQGPGVVHIMTQEDCQYLLHLSPQGGNPGSPLEGTVQSSGKMLGMFPFHLATCFGLSQILYNNVWFLVN